MALARVDEHIRAEAAALCDSGAVPGYVAGVHHAGEQVVVAHGVANVVTDAPMSEATGFLLGSITKVLTTTLLLLEVERGHVDLDERVIRYLPELALAPPAKPEELRVRNLVNHTDGIDGDLFFPHEVRGRAALEAYVEQLRRCSTLFDPGEHVSYSNPAFLVAGRLLEVVTGECFHDLLERELFGAVGMADSCTSAEQAILRSTAVGHFVDPATGAVRRTDMFMLPESWSACGSTPIVTIADLLAFARTHLADGVTPSGRRVLAAGSARLMREVTHDMGTPNFPPIGLGWWLPPFGETTVAWHGGGSPGGTATLMLVPDHDLAFAAFGNAGGAAALHDRMMLWLLREHLGLEVPEVAFEPPVAADLSAYEGSYHSDQLRWDVKAVDGQLEEAVTLEPLDATQAGLLAGFSGGRFPVSRRRLEPVAPGLFAPTDAAPGSFTGIGRTGLVSFHGDTGGRPAYRGFNARLLRREPATR